TGNPDHITRQAEKAINACDLILVPLKGEDKADLAGLRLAICKSCITNPGTRIVTFDLPQRDPATQDYLTRVNDWHDAIAKRWVTAIAQHRNAGGGARVGLLVWGDPSLYDSTLRIAERVAAKVPLHARVIPGITAIQALCAAHAIPFNDLGATVHVTTGRQLRDHGWPKDAETVIVMLDAGGAFVSLPGKEYDIWWGAYVGMKEEILVSGPLDAVGANILATRIQARADHGWIMDIYLLRKHLQKV
ncbi:precorrin-6A synthase (deacetylating), partial [Candidatus Oleimmundimicrobium sp.]|uniref:precorrin-6A synthase (deacetylating) n=1 Tax=Candidatus Oleimmundimicrobium sp. TaxID=3060597 RepID=UPI002721E420